ncbi:cbb3-type cytochrome c oxidase subunit 3 [Neomegalonema perideroedes]|uniref:cbb3-type cytochrome c oxidase subunit 3 n=1 Tax=Neomegalonema perideroedes TaxID=217219 RepID=UPI0003A74FCE|nr:cbb3-type cytochrome c oxidase subunit 3 [Neomegalonema perideroedes]
MMVFDHENLVRIAKSWGLFYMLAMAVGVVIYAYWPKNKTKFDEAGRSILDKDDKPWR